MEPQTSNDGDINRPEIVAAIEQLRAADPDGIVQPEAFVEAAKKKTSPLHSLLLWDDKEAGHQYRLAQARSLISRIRIRSIEDPDPRPAYVNLKVRTATGEERRGYMPLAKAVADPDLYRQVLADAVKGIGAYRNRMSAFEKAHEYVEGLDEVLRGMREETEGAEDQAAA